MARSALTRRAAGRRAALHRAISATAGGQCVLAPTRPLRRSRSALTGIWRGPRRAHVHPLRHVHRPLRHPPRDPPVGWWRRSSNPAAAWTRAPTAAAWPRRPPWLPRRTATCSPSVGAVVRRIPRRFVVGAGCSNHHLSLLPLIDRRDDDPASSPFPPAPPASPRLPCARRPSAPVPRIQHALDLQPRQID